jgi:hypothetical protein
MTEHALPEYEVYALRFASMTRRQTENFIFRDEHDGVVEMDFFVWLIRHGKTSVNAAPRRASGRWNAAPSTRCAIWT